MIEEVKLSRLVVRGQVSVGYGNGCTAFNCAPLKSSQHRLNSSKLTDSVIRPPNITSHNSAE
jgi:hypothetical protein